MSKVSFNNKQNLFFKALKAKVDLYFADNNIHTSGNRKLYIKSVIQVSSAIGLYVWLVFFTPSIALSIFLCILLGINLGVIGFNVMHEGGHNSFSKHTWLNETSGHFLNILGGNIHFWKIKHNINHHTYTNIEGMDSDIDILPYMRTNEGQPRYWFHRFQHIYWVILYGISYVVWIFMEDFVKYFSGKIGQLKTANTFNTKEHIIFWVTKIMYIVVYIVIPIFMVGFLKAFVGYSIVVFVCGLAISIVFQMAHVVEDTQFPTPDENSKINQEWALHQVSTTANFATKNKVVSWLLGGLNFQVEHHLFPKISHVHYPKINEFLKETCQQYNVNYIEYKSIFSAFGSHLAHIKRLGRVG